MSTRAWIGIRNKNGSIDAVYVHDSGYLSGVGHTLLHHYDSPAKVRRLIRLGGISILGEKIGSKHRFEDAYAQSRKGISTFYHRDRGDELDVMHFKNIKEFEESYREESWSIEYAYLYGDSWYWTRGTESWHPLNEEAMRRNPRGKSKKKGARKGTARKSPARKSSARKPAKRARKSGMPRKGTSGRIELISKWMRSQGRKVPRDKRSAAWKKAVHEYESRGATFARTLPMTSKEKRSFAKTIKADQKELRQFAKTQMSPVRSGKTQPMGSMVSGAETRRFAKTLRMNPKRRRHPKFDKPRNNPITTKTSHRRLHPENCPPKLASKLLRDRKSAKRNHKKRPYRYGNCAVPSAEYALQKRMRGAGKSYRPSGSTRGPARERVERELKQSRRSAVADRPVAPKASTGGGLMKYLNGLVDPWW